MTEEINHCYDGGLYAELVQNRAFLDDANQPVHWAAVGGATIALDPKQPLNSAIPTSLRVEIIRRRRRRRERGLLGHPDPARHALSSALPREGPPGFSGPLTVALENATARPFTRRPRRQNSRPLAVYDLTLTTVKDAKPPRRRGSRSQPRSPARSGSASSRSSRRRGRIVRMPSPRPSCSSSSI